MKCSDRQVALLLELQRRREWRRASNLAKIFDVSSQTIYGDLNALSEAGIPIITRRGKGCRLPGNFFLPPVQLTTNEAVLLLTSIGKERKSNVFGPAYPAALRGTSTKLLAVLPRTVHSRIAALKNKLRLLAVNTFDEP